MPTPLLNDDPGFFQTVEGFSVQEFIAKTWR